MKLIDWLEREAAHVGLEVEAGYEPQIPGLETLRPVARMPNLGGPMGMLIFDSDEVVLRHGDVLVAAGFGYTVLSEPLPNEPLDPEGFKEMAIDWGWEGPGASKPKWFP